MALENVTWCGELKEQLTESNDGKPVNFSDLNRDCLEKILEHLKIRDLLNAADTCKSFKEIAGDIFRRKFSKKAVCFNLYGQKNLARVNDNFIGIYALDFALQFFRCFGHLITKLTLDYTYAFPKIAQVNQYVRKYCRKSMNHITFIAIRGVYFENTIEPFLNVKTVKFNNCSLTMKLSQVNQWFPNMTELILFSTDLAEPQHFPHLERFIFAVKQGQIYFGQDDIATLIKLNPQLKSLSINAYQLNVKKFQDIGRHLPLLNDLNMTVSLKDLREIKSDIMFNSVKKFSLRFYGQYQLPKIPFCLRNLDELYLELECVLNDTSINFIARHPTITKLNINGMDVWSLKKIARALPSLREMQLTNSGVSAREVIEFVDDCKSLKSFIFILGNDFERNRSILKAFLEKEWEISFIGYPMNTNNPSVKIERVNRVQSSQSSIYI